MGSREAKVQANPGHRVIEVRDPLLDVSITVHVTYPTDATVAPVKLGPFTIELAENAPVLGHDRPLVMLSHGTGSTPALFRDLWAYLARAGFVVAALMHPGNNRFDDRLAGTRENFVNRPRHVSLAIDRALAEPWLGPHLREDRIGVIGHSLGGYTALALAGGHPSTLPHETEDGAPRPLPVTRDPRVAALVLLTPATPWYGRDGALRDVDVPIQLWSAALDEAVPLSFGELVARGVRHPSHVEHHVIENAGHFSVVSPYPPELVKPEIPPSQDPPGFDRREFSKRLHPAITEFLARTIGN